MAASLASRLTDLHARIADAARQAGRDPRSIHLLAVSKTQPASAILSAYDAGLRAFGENYVQEALSKQPQLPADIEWHCIGPLQSNKSKPVAEHFAWCQSVDSLKLAERLARQRPAGLPALNVCLQLNVGAEVSKSGITAAEAGALAEAVAALPGLRLRGLMTIPPPSDDPGQQRRWFAEARGCFEALQRQHPSLDTLSMGMSSDLEAAIAEGSTLIRIGTALFGARPPTR
ncbi:YggS family pyridoxal phosphate-dependent enzyme [Permianibacter sp. IMCC34836]|uniref:YggS family pyridoxal phosphate-dependent enzyme n=1 Tax=Permianibacter fluminis TaxID=2738515 RepID=UPI001553E0D8|nr:YggS family pyridoxal phosphate-dependent enzyme [Permianibacter fluminis]NQD35821.1 YggS family pyridoxal phosphate-dependent enzyme [Permianibacter fluminis]